MLRSVRHYAGILRDFSGIIIRLSFRLPNVQMLIALPLITGIYGTDNHKTGDIVSGWKVNPNSNI